MSTSGILAVRDVGVKFSPVAQSMNSLVVEYNYKYLLILGIRLDINEPFKDMIGITC